MRKNIIILGSTGSVGENAVRVASALRDRIRVTGIVGNRNRKRLAEQAALLGCNFAATGSGSADELRAILPPGCRAYAGPEAVDELVCGENVDLILCAIVGTAGLSPVLHAIDAGKTVALASKEVLVMAGDEVMRKSREKNVPILPVDSEHSAIFQCLQGNAGRDLERVILTASGGPFRKIPAEKLARVSCADAMRHPTWNMGPKVTIDSATLMNKALEMVEAHHLFQTDADHIGVVVHPQSVVHSMVEFTDGVLLAQMSLPDMRYPIQYALTWPGRCDGGLGHLNLTKLSGLTFEEPDRKRFPSLDFADFVIRCGGVYPAVMNAANEIAVERFRRGEIGFTKIFETVEKTLSAVTVKGSGLEDVRAADAEARRFAASAV